MSEQSETPEYPQPWMPLAAGEVEIVGWDGYSYVDRAGRTYWSGQAEPSEADARAAVTTPRTPPVTARWRVLKDTVWMRVKAAGRQLEAEAFITSLGTSQRLDWDSQSWFWSDNAALRQVCVELGTDPDVIMAADPLAP